MTPRVSVLMTIFNPGRFLAPAIESILRQTYHDFELIAVENGSTDGAKAVIQKYAEVDKRIRLFDLPKNIGRVSALNYGLSKAKGDLIAILDADDISESDRFARQVEIMNGDDEVVLVGSHVRQIDSSDNLIGVLEFPADPAQLYDALAYSNPFSHSAVMFRRAAAKGGYPREFVYGQDFALWLALAQRGKLAMIEKPLVSIREHPSRIGRSHEYADIRVQEVVELYRRALRLPGLSAAARERGRINLARHRYFFGLEALLANKWFTALGHFSNCFIAAPAFCAGRIWIRVLMVGKFIRLRRLSSRNS